MSNQTVDKIFDRLDPKDTPWGQLLWGTAGTILIRLWLEWLSNNSVPAWTTYIHFGMWWVDVMLCIGLVCNTMNRLGLSTNLKWVMRCSPIIALPPILDLIIQPWTGQYRMLYIETNIPREYFTFFTGMGYNGATPGIRVEIAIVILFAGWLTYRATHKWTRAVLTSWAVYTTIFVWGCAATIIWGLLAVLHLPELTHGGPKDPMLCALTNCICISAVTLGFIYLRRTRATLTKAIMKDMRWNRILTYLAIATWGLIISPGKWVPEVWFQIPSLGISIVLACVHAIIRNNLADVETDRLTNKNRPTIKGNIDLKEYRLAGFWALAGSQMLAWQTNPKVGIGVTAFTLAYEAYTNWPWRLKRFPIIAKITIGAAGLGCFCAGIGTTQPWLGRIIMPHSASQADRPSEVLITYFIIGFGMASNMIDIKDRESDKKTGIKTLVNILPEQVDRHICGLLCLIGYIWAPLALNIGWLAPVGGALGLIHWMLLIKEKYNETPAMWLQCTTHWALALALILH